MNYIEPQTFQSSECKLLIREFFKTNGYVVINEPNKQLLSIELFQDLLKTKNIEIKKIKFYPHKSVLIMPVLKNINEFTLIPASHKYQKETNFSTGLKLRKGQLLIWDSRLVYCFTKTTPKNINVIIPKKSNEIIDICLFLILFFFLIPIDKKSFDL